MLRAIATIAVKDALTVGHASLKFRGYRLNAVLASMQAATLQAKVEVVVWRNEFCVERFAIPIDLRLDNPKGRKSHRLLLALGQRAR